MKYYHLIYNSSERSIKGAPGFGVHTYSEDLPKEVLATIEKDPEIFSFQYKGIQLNPNSLSELPESILGIIPTWIYATIPMGADKVHVLGRKIAVGFDYSFYKTGKPTRLGNYVGDYYITLETPTRDFWNLMYTRTDGTQFMPASPIPSLENEDMKEISLGEAHLLAPTNEIVAKPTSGNGVNEYALEIVFAILESRRQNKPLLIKMHSKNTADIMADVFRMLPIEVAENSPFTTNYHQMGRRQGYNIFIINESYQGQIVADQWVDIDLINGKTVHSVERDIFLSILRDFANRGEWQYIHNAISWMGSDDYRILNSNDQDLHLKILNYLNCDDFDFDALKRDGRLIVSLAPILQKHSDKRDYLNDNIWLQIQGVKGVEDIKDISNTLHVLSPLGTKAIADEWKPVATEIAFQSRDSFVRLYNSVVGNLNQLSNVVDFTECSKHREYLSAFVMYPQVWRTLRQYFIPNASEDFENFVLLLIKENFKYTDALTAIDDVDLNRSKLLDALVNIYIKSTHVGDSKEDQHVWHSESERVHEVAYAWIVNVVRGNLIKYYSFREKVPNILEDIKLSPLYIWELQKKLSVNFQRAQIDECSQIIKSLGLLFEKHELIKQEIRESQDSWNSQMVNLILNDIYKVFTNLLVVSENANCDSCISDCIDTIVKLFGFSKGEINKFVKSHRIISTLNNFIILQDVLMLNTQNFTESHITKAIELKRSTYLKYTLPTLLTKKLSLPEVNRIAVDYVDCRAMSSDELLVEVKKKEYDLNRHDIWVAVLKNLNLTPKNLVNKLAGLYEAPDSKGKYSKDAIGRALNFMKAYLPNEYALWYKENNTPLKKLLRKIGECFHKSAEADADDEPQPPKHSKKK